MYKQQSNLRDAELRTYQAQKYGFMNFVSGGLLIGDKMEVADEDEAPRRASLVTMDKPAEEITSSKKRKAGEIAAEPLEEKRLKKKKKSCDLRAATEAAALQKEEPETSTTSKQSKKEKQRRRPDVDASVKAVEPGTVLSGDAEERESKEARRARKAARKAERAARHSETEVSTDEKARLKEEKRAHKADRRKRKEEKRKLKAGKPEAAAAVLPTPPSGVSTPTLENLAFGGSRHAVRQRYILQKRMASLDPQALKEILMIKAQA